MDTLEAFLSTNDATLIIPLLQRLEIPTTTRSNFQLYLPDDVAIKLVHGDLHEGNITFSKGKVRFIDLEEVSSRRLESNNFAKLDALIARLFSLCTQNE
jgi:hypothetical protein